MCPCSPPVDVYCSRIYCRFDFCLAAYICTQAKERLNVNESKSVHLGSFCLDSVMVQDGFWATSSTDAHTASRCAVRHLDATSWRAPRSGGRRAPGRSLRGLPTARRSDDERREFLRQQTASICGAYIPPRRWVSRARFLAIAGGADALDSPPVWSLSSLRHYAKAQLIFQSPLLLVVL